MKQSSDNVFILALLSIVRTAVCCFTIIALYAIEMRFGKGPVDTSRHGWDIIDKEVLPMNGSLASQERTSRPAFAEQGGLPISDYLSISR